MISHLDTACTRQGIDQHTVIDLRQDVSVCGWRRQREYLCDPEFVYGVVMRTRITVTLAVSLLAGVACGISAEARAALPKSDMAFDIQSDHPGQLAFFGSKTAVLFTKEIDQSFQGVLTKDYVSKPGGRIPPGFINASPPGQPWYGTMWSRDVGTFMRELVFWGYYAHACQVAQCVMNLVGSNRHGFVAFPEYFTPTRRDQIGTEMDGQAASIIAMVALWQRLPTHAAFRARLYQFLHQNSSPLRGMDYVIHRHPLVAGSGEFGGGRHEAYNIVQNNLCALAFISAARMEEQAGDRPLVRRWRSDARLIYHRIKKYLINKHGGWIWNLNIKTLKPTPSDRTSNAGTGGLNGALSMSADVLGFDPGAWPWQGLWKHGEKTFYELYDFPPRKEQFKKYGIWPQMDYMHDGLLTSPSYGQGYALQSMLLLNKLAMAGHGLHFLAWATYKSPHEVFSFRKWHYGRESPYYFYERLYSPDAYHKILMTAGCGPLNLVNVSEPLKVARLIAGVDDTSLEQVRIIPRVPPTWSGYRMKNWPILTRHGVVRADISYQRKHGTARLSVIVTRGESIPKLEVLLPGRGVTSWAYQQTFKNVTNLHLKIALPPRT